MYNIALVNYDNYQNGYIEGLEQSNCSIHHLDSNFEEQDVRNMDAVIISESSLDDMGKTCESILHAKGNTQRYILVLSEKSTKVSRIIYLQLGVDGIFDMDMDSDEFCLYVKNMLQRGRGQVQSQPTFEIQEKMNKVHKENEVGEMMLELVPNNFSVKIAGKGEINLTKLEYKVLNILVEQKGEAISYEDLYLKVWGMDVDNDVKKYRVSNLIFHLRKKLGEDSYNPFYIKTIRSRGYMIAT